MPHVFVSYVREDASQVNRLCADLAQFGVKVWLDKDNIKPGARWKDAIRDAIKGGDYFVACFSKNYVSRSSSTKTYMNEELQLALDELRQYGPNRSWFIPVLLSECEVPSLTISARETLQDVQWVVLFRNWEEGVAKILGVIKPISPEVSFLMHALTSGDSTVRMDALVKLKTANEPRVVPIIAPLLHADKREAEVAAELIGKIGGPFAVPALVQFIRDSQPDTRTPPDYLKDVRFARFEPLGQSLRGHAMHALCEIRDPRATTFLIEALKDPEHYVRDCAAKGLGKARDPAAVPALITYLADSDKGARMRAVKALDGIGDRDRSAVPALIEMLNDRRLRADERVAVSEALGSIGDPVAIPALIEMFKEVKTDYGARQIGRTIKKIGGSSALFFLHQDLTSSDRTTCNKAVAALGEIPGPTTLALLIGVLRDPKAAVHTELLANTLGDSADEKTLQPLIQALKDAHPVVRRRAAAALEVVVGKEYSRVSPPAPAYAIVESPLIESVRDSDAGTRARAIRALASLEDKRIYRRGVDERKPVFDALSKALKQEDDSRVQFVLIKCLERSFKAAYELQVVKKILSKNPPHPNVFSRQFDEDSVWKTFESDGGSLLLT
jgi:HEAT repeat protein